jgi:hypothetical protein
MAVTALLLDINATSFVLVMARVAVVALVLLVSVARRPLTHPGPTPRLLRWALAVEVLVLVAVGVMLEAAVPNTLPWQLSRESSVLYGWVFVGLAVYYLYAVLRPNWEYAVGPLLGFLLYDLVLAGPLFSRFGSVAPEQVRASWSPPG